MSSMQSSSTKGFFEKENAKAKWFHLRMELKYCTTKIIAGICKKLSCLIYIGDELKVSKTNKEYKEALLCLRGEALGEDDIKVEILKIACFIHMKTQQYGFQQHPMNGFIYVKAIHHHTNVCFFLRDFHIKPAFLTFCEQECETNIPRHLKSYAEIMSSLQEENGDDIPNIEFSDINEWNTILLTSEKLQNEIKTSKGLKRKNKNKIPTQLKKKREALEKQMALLESQEAQQFRISESDSEPEENTQFSEEEEDNITEIDAEEEAPKTDKEESVSLIRSYLNNLKEKDENIVQVNNI